MDATTLIEYRSIACALCGADAATPLMRGHDWLHGNTGEFTIAQCRRCGLVYQQPRPTANSLARFYPSVYAPFHAHMLQPKPQSFRRRLIKALFKYRYGYADENSHMMHRALAPFDWLYRTVNFTVIPYVRGGRVLDVGCGSGGYLVVLRKMGWQTAGVEINAMAVQVARASLGLNVIHSDLEGAAFPSESFDVVTMWWYLEHTPQPLDVLCEARRVLKEGGWLAIGVPNWGSAERRIFGRAWYHLDLPRHLYLFSRSTLNALLRRAGFQEIKLRTGSWLDDPAYSIERWRQIRTGTYRRMPRAVRLALAPSAWLAARLGYGSLLIAHARKGKGHLS